MMSRRSTFFAALAVIALLTKIEPGSAHSMSRLGTVESIVDRHTLQLDDSIFADTIDKVYKDGHFYSHQPPLLSVLEAPVYAVLRLPGTRFNNRGRFVMIYGFTLLTNGLALAGTVMVFASLLSRLNPAGVGTGVLPVLLVFGTWLLPYGLVVNNHGISALLLAVLLALVLEVDRRGPTDGRLLAIGGVLGLLVAVEWLPIVSFLPITLIYLAMRRDVRAGAWLRFAVGIGVPLLAHAIINFQVTGDVMPAGFHAELFRYEGSSFDESSLTGTIKYTAIGPAAFYAWHALFVEKGFFVFAPLCLLGAIVGVLEWRWWLAHAKGLYFVLLGGTLSSLGAALLTTNNFGGEAVGFRHAVFLCPAFVMLLFPWLTTERTVRRTVVASIAAVSTAAMLLFAVRQPWSILTLTKAPIGSWEQYVPVVDKVIHLKIFSP
jgi:hypothetical protein